MVDFAKSAETRQILLKLEAQGFSQFEIGRRTGISRGQVYNILRQRTGAGTKSIKAATTSKRISDPMLILTTQGTITAEPVNWRQRQLVGGHWSAISYAKDRGEWSRLDKFKNRRVVVLEDGERKHYSLVTDEKELKRLDDQDQLDPKEEIAPGSDPTRE